VALDYSPNLRVPPTHVEFWMNLAIAEGDTFKKCLIYIDIERFQIRNFFVFYPADKIKALAPVFKALRKAYSLAPAQTLTAIPVHSDEIDSKLTARTLH